MQSRYNAFSLVELMVVITIVAILATVATPVLRNYIVKARAAKIVPQVESLMTKMITYATIHGYFPNAYQLNLSATPDEQSVDDPGPLLSLLQIYDNSEENPCGQRGMVWGRFNPTALGLASGVSEDFHCNLWNYKGTISKFCGTTGYDFDSSKSLSDSLIAGWHSYYSNSQLGNDEYVQALVNSTYWQATCM